MCIKYVATAGQNPMKKRKIVLLNAILTLKQGTPAILPGTTQKRRMRNDYLH